MDIQLSESKMTHEIRQMGLIQACMDLALGDVSGKRWALLDFPFHDNVGDSAIWMGTLRILQARFGSVPTLVSRNKTFPKYVDERIGNGPLVFLGGGNFGDIWDGYWQNRVNVLRQFPNRQIIQMPQTIYFENISNSALLETQRAIASHRDFTLLVRDRVSLEFCHRNFDCPTYLCPDLAFGLGRLREVREPFCDIYGLLRTDKEKKTYSDMDLQRDPEFPISDWFSPAEGTTRKYKLQKKISLNLERLGKFGMTSLERNFASQAEYQLNRGIEILSRGKVVITDRLHGHILCSLMRKPHIVIDNAYGKVGNYIDAFPDEKITVRAKSMNEALAFAQDINTR